MKDVEFWSSVEHATFQKGLVRALMDSGWKAEHRYQVSQEDYWNARSRTARLSLRLRTYGAYPLRIFRHFTGAGADGVGVICTNTFFAPWVAAVATGRRGRPLVHWVFDLYPDVLVTAGAMHPNSFWARLAKRIVRSTFDRAAVNVFLGSRLREFAEQQFGPIPRSVVIPVGCDAEPFRDLQPAPRPFGAPLRILYCGNLGRMHDTETFVEALRIGLPRDIIVEFCGNGPGFRSLEVRVRSLGLQDRVRFGPNLAENEWVRAMGAADVGFVTMRHGAEGVVMPSKSYSSLAAGQALLAVCPASSDLADTVRGHGCGWVIEPGDAAGLAKVWEEMAHNPNGVLDRRRRAWRAGRDVFDQRALVSSWAAVFNSLRPDEG
jgi:glycosyltransferase involved in cell wall biosynthesis